TCCTCRSARSSGNAPPQVHAHIRRPSSAGAGRSHASSTSTATNVVDNKSNRIDDDRRNLLLESMAMRGVDHVARARMLSSPSPMFRKPAVFELRGANAFESVMRAREQCSGNGRDRAQAARLRQVLVEGEYLAPNSRSLGGKLRRLLLELLPEPRKCPR